MKFVPVQRVPNVLVLLQITLGLDGAPTRPRGDPEAELRRSLVGFAAVSPTSRCGKARDLKPR